MMMMTLVKQSLMMIMTLMMIYDDYGDYDDLMMMVINDHDLIKRMMFRQFNDRRVSLGQHSQVSCQGQGGDCWHGCQGELDPDVRRMMMRMKEARKAC